MIEDERVDNRLMDLENGIEELIEQINDFRNELPRPEMKKLRGYLEKVKKGRNKAYPTTLRKEQLMTALEVAVNVLNEAMDNSRLGKLAEAHKHALDLLIKFF